jgi:ribosome-associated heat shock protein Hsp15
LDSQLKIRLDKYLWAIRIFKTRTLASKACDEGKVKANETIQKASKTVKVGERYQIKYDTIFYDIEVLDLLNQRRSASEVAAFFKNHAPIQIKKERSFESAFFVDTGKRKSRIGRPTKKIRRNLDDFTTFENQ